MDKLRELAADAVTELRINKGGPRVRAFADHMNALAVRGMSDLELEKWRAIAIAVGENFSCDADLYLWIRGVAGEASLAALQNQRQVNVWQLRGNVQAICEAIVRGR